MQRATCNMQHATCASAGEASPKGGSDGAEEGRIRIRSRAGRDGEGHGEERSKEEEVVQGACHRDW